MKMIKVLFLILLLFVFVCLFAIGALLYFFDPNQIKPALIEKFKKETGYQLNIEGKLTWSLYPNIGVKADHVIINASSKPGHLFEAIDVQLSGDLVTLLKDGKQFFGKLYIDKLFIKNIRADKLHATLTADNNSILLKDIDADFYQGSLSGNVTGNYLSNKPYWQYNVEADDIEIKKLLQDVHGDNTKINISGTGNFKAKGEMLAAQSANLLNAINGTADLTITKGVVDGIDIPYFLQTANLLFNKEASTIPQNTNQTFFDDLKASWLIKNGKAETHDLQLNSSSFSVKGQGYIILSSSELNFTLQTKPLLENAKIHWDIPILITGNLDAPQINLNLPDIKKEVTKQQINKIKDKAIEKIQQYIPGETGDFLQQLLGK